MKGVEGMISMSEYDSIAPAWCPGCGDFGILNALKKALVDLGKAPHEVLICSGIGQAAKLPHYLRCNVFNGLHGRGLPAATGAWIANRQLTVLAVGGDGDMYGEGGNHFLHALRRNPDITLIVHDNKIYGLTKGQASPTSDQGTRTKVQPQGTVSRPLNPLALAISQKCGYVARGFAGWGDHLAGLIRDGIGHRGFSLIDVLQPCVSFNKINTYAWYRERIYDMNKDPSYSPGDLHGAMEKAYEWGARIPVGLFYQSEAPSYEDLVPEMQETALVDREMDIETMQAIMAEFT